MLESITIGDNSLCYVGTFKINGLDELRSLVIGMNSFTLLRMGSSLPIEVVNNSSRSFSIINCDELESIEIGRISFFDYAGGFELANLPKLSTIKIGEIGWSSYNFFFNTLVIKGK